MSSVDVPLSCFAGARARALARISDTSLDRAPAGGVDVAAAPLVKAINAMAADYATTSTCAGRCVVFGFERDDAKRGKWLLNSHDPITSAQVRQALEGHAFERATVASLKFEPPIAHVRCASVSAASRLVRLAVECGFRESGIVLGNGKAPMAALRSTGNALDAPLGICEDGEWKHLPSDDHLEFVVAEANARFVRAREKLDALASRLEREANAEPRDGKSADSPRALVVSPRHARAVKVALEAAGGYDKRFKIANADGNLDRRFKIAALSGGRASKLAIPLTSAAALQLEDSDSELSEKLRGLMRLRPAAPTAENDVDENGERSDDGSEFNLAPFAPQASDAVAVARLSRASKISAAFAQRDAALAATLPRKWGVLGDDALLVPGAVVQHVRQSPQIDVAALWRDVALAGGTQRVFRDAEIAANGHRSSQRELLYFNPSVYPTPEAATRIVIKEGGISYGFDATTTMFSPGNNTERLRHATFPCEGQTVVDLYAGIGYFSLPMLKRGATFLHACEWSPDAAKALRSNLVLNGVADRCRVYEADNATTAPTLGRIAHRVSLGLTPTSRQGWALACALVHPTGATLHVHENVKVDETNASLTPSQKAKATFLRWGGEVAAALQALLIAERGPGWQCSCTFVSRVKDYAPRVHHLVADVACTPPSI
ncbi:methyltransferase TYW3-domain-containing protein [Pelagophyceae sp. CCMP2097]|nr:methyltransferase TYW3-domain-containing protein [Pelagophyceae sp. CCMP2097]